MKKTIAAILSVSAVFVTASAQTLQTEYFLDNNVYSYRFNPAISGEKGFAGFILNNYSMGGASNLGVGSLIFKDPAGNGLVTGFNSAISPDQFLGGLKRSNNINLELDESLLSFGFWTKRDHFHNVEVNLRTLVGAGIPGDLFTFLKTGNDGSTSDLSALGFNAQAFAEVAYGFSTPVGKSFTVGGRFKFLAGLADFRIGCNTADFTVNSQNIRYETDLYMKAAASFAEIGTKPSENDKSVRVFDFDNVNILDGKFQPGGLGAALDLGMTYKPVNGLTLSLSLLDLGGINWKYNIFGSAGGADKFTGVLIKSLSNTSSIRDEFDQTLENLKKTIEFKPEKRGEVVNSFEMLPLTVNLGARYRMPFYKRLSVGAAGTFRTTSLYSFWETRAGLTITPINWFSLTGNYGVNSYGFTYGTAMSLNVANFNFRFAMESYSGRTGSFIPEKSTQAIPYPVGPFKYQMNFGITLTFGKRHNSFARKAGSGNLPLPEQLSELMPEPVIEPERFRTDSTALHVISNHSGMEARITDFGARVVSLCVPGADGKKRDVVLGFGDIQTYTSNVTSFGATVGPYANRIANGKFILDGTEYMLEVNSAPNSMHCGDRGWRHSCFKVLEKSENSIKLGIIKPDGQFGLPGDVEFSVLYTVTEDNRLDIVYEAETSAPTIFNVTNHSFFNLSGDYHRTVLGDVLTIDADSFTPVDGTMIPTGEFMAVTGTPFDFRIPKAIGTDIEADDAQLRMTGGYDHNYVLNHPGDDSVIAASLYCPESGIRMDVYTDQPGIQFFSANRPNDTLLFKDGKLQTARAAVCLETQHFPDSPNHPDFPSTVLRPGEKFRSHTAYAFSTEK